MTRMIPQYAAWLVPVARLREFNNTPNASRIAIFQEVRFEIVEEISRHKKFRLLGQVVPTIAELLPVNTFLHVDNKERPAEIQCLSTMRKWFRRQILRSILRDRAVLCAAIMLQEQPQGIAAAADNLNSRLLEDLEVTDGDSVQILARATSTFCHANPGLRLKSLYYPECLFLENGVRVNAADVRVEANYSRMASKLITRLHPGFPVTWPTSPLRNHHCDECGQTLTWIELVCRLCFSCSVNALTVSAFTVIALPLRSGFDVDIAIHTSTTRRERLLRQLG